MEVATTMKVVALVRGGKDSCYAMMKAIHYGHEVSFSFSIFLVFTQRRRSGMVWVRGLRVATEVWQWCLVCLQCGKCEGEEEGSFRAWQLRQFVHFCKCFSMVGRIQLRVSGSPTVSSELRHRVARELCPNPQPAQFRHGIHPCTATSVLLRLQ